MAVRIFEVVDDELSLRRVQATVKRLDGNQYSSGPAESAASETEKELAV
jgi:hypothetical protein